MWYVAAGERNGGHETLEVSCTGNVVDTVVWMLCVMMTIGSTPWTDAEGSASLRGGENGSDVLLRHWYACMYMFRPPCLAEELSRWNAIGSPVFACSFVRRWDGRLQGLLWWR